MKKLIVAALVLLTIGFGAAAYLFYFDLYHFDIVQPGVLYRDGFQGMRRFENAYRYRPFKTVVNIQSDADLVQYKVSIAEQAAFMKKHNIAWHHIPMKQRTEPTQAQVDEFLRIMRDPKNHPVLTHDSQGVIRMGMMVAVWQKEGMGYDYEKTMSSVKSFGHKESPELIGFIKKLFNKT